MSGHNKWSTIKHKKGAADARRGKIFTKLIKEITVAARMGGGDPAANPRLRSAVLAAKSENMPKDNIDRAIKKGTGELEGVSYEEVVYEGYGPGGAAILVESLTDNRNRAVAEIRHILNKGGGNMGSNGCVAWMFDLKGYISLDRKKVDEDMLMETALKPAPKIFGKMGMNLRSSRSRRISKRSSRPSRTPALPMSWPRSPSCLRTRPHFRERKPNR